MRVLMVSGSLPPMPCGVGDYTAGLAEALANQSSVTVVMLGGTCQRRGGIVGLQFLPQVRRWGWGSTRAMASALRCVVPDIVHFQFPTQGFGRHILPWLLPVYAALRGFRVVITWHEYAVGSLPRYLAGAFAASAFVVVRPNFRDHMSSVIRKIVARKRIEFIPGVSVIPRCELAEGEIAKIRDGFAAGTRKVISYFGFSYPAKGTHRLFEILDPERHHLVLIGKLEHSDAYQSQVLKLAQSERWRGKVTIMGFQPPVEVAALLAASDAVLLPFSQGGGVWNSSLHAAALQGTFIVTTAYERQGYDPGLNVHYTSPDDIPGMRKAIDLHCGKRLAVGSGSDWDAAAQAHLELYRQVLGAR